MGGGGEEGCGERVCREGHPTGMHSDFEAHVYHFRALIFLIQKQLVVFARMSILIIFVHLAQAGQQSLKLFRHNTVIVYTCQDYNNITSRSRFSLSSFFPTWHVSPVTDKFSAFSASTALSTFFCFLLLTTTLAPSSASRLAMAKPILQTIRGQIPLRTLEITVDTHVN